MGFDMVMIRQLFLALVFSILLVSCDLEALSAIMGTMEDNILVDPEDPSSAEEKLKVLTALLEAEDKTVRTDEFCWNEIYQEKFGSEWVEIRIHESDGRLTEWIPFPWGGGKEVEIASWSIPEYHTDVTGLVIEMILSEIGLSKGGSLVTEDKHFQISMVGVIDLSQDVGQYSFKRNILDDESHFYRFLKMAEACQLDSLSSITGEERPFILENLSKVVDCGDSLSEDLISNMNAIRGVLSKLGDMEENSDYDLRTYLIDGSYLMYDGNIIAKDPTYGDVLALQVLNRLLFGDVAGAVVESLDIDIDITQPDLTGINISNIGSKIDDLISFIDAIGQLADLKDKIEVPPFDELLEMEALDGNSIKDNFRRDISLLANIGESFNTIDINALANLLIEGV